MLEARRLLAAPAILAGSLDPGSDSGSSDSDGITNVDRPTFSGTAAPLARVALAATAEGSAAPLLTGQATADAGGAWSITSIPLPDGSYTIRALAVPVDGSAPTQAQILPGTTAGPLVVDTVAPRVDDLSYLPFTGRFQAQFQDDRSGLAQPTLVDGANYAFARVANLPGQGPPRILPPYAIDGLSTTASPDPTAAQVVVATIDANRPIRGGVYRVAIRSGGVADVAGNALDGEYHGFFPSGNDAPGGNFLARLANVHRRIRPPAPVGPATSPPSPPGRKPKATTTAGVRLDRPSSVDAAARIISRKLRALAQGIRVPI